MIVEDGSYVFKLDAELPIKVCFYRDTSNKTSTNQKQIKNRPPALFADYHTSYCL